MTPLAKFSWSELIEMYRQYGEQLKEYQRIKNDITNMWLGRGFNTLSLDAWWFDSAFDRDVRKLNNEITVLDIEFKRRGDLIGVI